VVDRAGLLDQGRTAYAAEAWRTAFGAFSVADEVEALEPADLESWGRAAYMLGDDEIYVSALERAHALYQEPAAAARCGFWIGHSLLFRGQGELADGWFAAGRRALDEARLDCAERGYLLIPRWLRQIGRGEYAAGLATTDEAVAIGERFGDQDLVWLARDDQARALVKQGRLDEGLALVSEVFAVVRSGVLSPMVSGIVYCNTIDYLRDADEIRHTRVWTDALALWCQGRPEMVAHNGLCLVHRAEMLQLRGDWPSALAEAAAALERFADGMLNRIAVGKAHYRQAEIHRLQGRRTEAETAYREASRHGCDPYPGLALLRLGQGRAEDAAASIRRAVAEQVQPLQRAALLPAYVEIMLARGDVETARAAETELAAISGQHPADGILAGAEYIAASVALASDDEESRPVALMRAREAWRRWQDLDAPYDAARARLLVGLACRALDDDDGARLELEAARETFVVVGAAPDVDRVDRLLGGRATHPLSGREVEVLRLAARGMSNREIGDRLVISEHTVARHLQNIFIKLGVSSRTAATSFALEHGLLEQPSSGQV
jgi:DNA-binding CsgD family transcriptional regulator/tetratricopeptide (TPR) repeat protein